MRTEFWYFGRPDMIRPVWPPEIPKTYSMPASCSTRPISSPTGSASVSIRSIAMTLSSVCFGHSLESAYGMRQAADHEQIPGAQCNLRHLHGAASCELADIENTQQTATTLYGPKPVRYLPLQMKRHTKRLRP